MGRVRYDFPFEENKHDLADVVATRRKAFNWNGQVELSRLRHHVQFETSQVIFVKMRLRTIRDRLILVVETIRNRKR